MNKKVVLAAIASFVVAPLKSQIATWLIPPLYNEIGMANGEDLIVTDSLGQKTIWSLLGTRLAATNNELHPFVEDYAVTTAHGSEIITGFYDAGGGFTPLTGCSVAYSKPCFSDGYLLVVDGDYFRFVNSKGETTAGQYINAYPFANGYASCNTYANMLKKKDPYNLLITKELAPVSFSFGDKQFDDDDIEFVSSVNDENIGIVVAKHKLYRFNGRDKSLSPIFATKDETNIKNQAKLDDDLALCLSQENDSVTVLTAKCGKSDRIKIRFDPWLMPLSMATADGDYTFHVEAEKKRVLESPLRVVRDGERCGISWGSLEILPPQFDEVMSCFADKAFVDMNGKCGMLQVLKDESFKIVINKGNAIDFRHQKYETTIRLDLPKAISAYKSRIEIDQQSGCEVDMPSGEKKDTEYGNYIQYDCVLNIPESLPDEMYDDARNEIVYPVQVVYDGLWSPVILFKVKAWHYKYFNVDVNDAETSINKGDLSFTFNINAERNPGEAVYPTSVNIKTDSLQCELEKISETRYKCKVLSLNEGVNNIVVQILEQGCPPASFPFEVTYTRPAARTRNNPAVKEDVVIKKKTKVLSAPHLDI